MDLHRDDPVRLELELAKAGTTAAYLVSDAWEEPVLRDRLEPLSPEAQLRLALEWFGDGGHPQPAKRTRPPSVVVGDGYPRLGSLTPDWGRLPRLETDQSPAEPRPTPKPRYRPPDEIPKATVKQLKMELAQREAKRKGRRRVPELTQARIAAIVGLDDTRVQQAEALQQVGWDLLRTHPDFSVDEGFVRWPSVKKAAQILDSERTAK